jgi:hypothetical protein
VSPGLESHLYELEAYEGFSPGGARKAKHPLDIAAKAGLNDPTETATN